MLTEKQKKKLRDYYNNRKLVDPIFAEAERERLRKYHKDRYRNDSEFRKNTNIRSSRLGKARYCNDPDFRQRKAEHSVNSLVRRLRDDPSVRIKSRYRRAQAKAIYHKVNSLEIISLCGTTGEGMQIHMLNQHPNRSWQELVKNGYQVHHIEPISKMVVSDDVNVKRHMSYKNLQLIPWQENTKIGSRPIKWETNGTYSVRIANRWIKNISWQKALDLINCYRLA